jgi:nitrogen fixation protein FixH
MKTRRFRLFPGIIFALLGLNMCIVGATVFAAHAHRSSLAIESEYDRKALHWDETVRQLGINSKLGWSLRIISTDAGQLWVSLDDRDSKPLDGADVRVEAFHHAHANDRVNTTLTSVSPGEYAGKAQVAIPGLWDFRFTVHHGSDTFTSTVTRAVLGDGGGGT